MANVIWLRVEDVYNSVFIFILGDLRIYFPNFETLIVDIGYKSYVNRASATNNMT